MNPRDEDMLTTRKEIELFSHEIERQKARKQMKRYLNSGDLCEFYKEQENGQNNEA